MVEKLIYEVNLWAFTIAIQQNLVGSDPVVSEPRWEAILNFQKKFEISDFP